MTDIQLKVQKPLKDLVYLELKHKILTGEIVSQTRLMEIDLSEKMNVSRTPIREAIKRLSDDGLVKVERDEGTGEQSTVYGTSETDSGSTTHGHVITHGFNSGESNQGSTVFGHTITTEHDLHVHGNIGTVTAQKMITEERELAMFNLYDLMIQDFKDRFLILVY